MALVVEHALPYSSSALRLNDPLRWSKVSPLIRPSLRCITSSSSCPILVDTSLRSTTDIQIAVLGTVGSSSSKIFAGSKFAAFASQPYGSTNVTLNDITSALKDCDVPYNHGLVLVKSGSRQDLRIDEKMNPGIVEIEVVGEAKMDHVLSLLLASSPMTKSSIEVTCQMLRDFLKSSAKTTSSFLEQKLESKPSIVHAIDTTDFNSAKASIVKDVTYLLSSRPATVDSVYSIHYADINGLSRLENGIIAHEISHYFQTHNLPGYISQSSIVSSFNKARGWTISVCPLSSKYLSEAPKPSTNTLPASQPNNKSSGTPPTVKPQLSFSEAKIRSSITAGCHSVIEAEPTITQYDTIVGDGDCGYTLRDGARQVLSLISAPRTTSPDPDPDPDSDSGSDSDSYDFPAALALLVDELEVGMGGTSGALYCIFLSALAQSLAAAPPSLADALRAALEHLLGFTRARRGDRTCLDCLIPFVEGLGRTGDAAVALDEATRGVDGTMHMDAKVGRSSYLDENVTRGIPDPGAYGLLKLLEGLVSGL